MARIAEHDVDGAEYAALADFRYQLRRFLRASEELTRKGGLTPLQYQLLLQVRGGCPGRAWATVGELAERLQAKHHGVVALVTRCETAGLVRRQEGRDDLRRVEVHLTPKGERRLAVLAAQHRAQHLALHDEFALPRFTPRPAGMGDRRRPRTR